MNYYLVQGDTGSQIKVDLSRKGTTEAVDLTNATCVLKVRKEATAQLSFTTIGVLEIGSTSSVVFLLGDDMLTIEPGRYEAEVEVTFTSAGETLIESVYEIIQLFVREDF